MFHEILGFWGFEKFKKSMPRYFCVIYSEQTVWAILKIWKLPNLWVGRERLRVNYGPICVITCQLCMPRILKNDTKAKKTRSHGLIMDSFYFFGWISQNIGYKDIYGFFSSWRVFTSGQFPNGQERLRVNYKKLRTKVFFSTVLWKL